MLDNAFQAAGVWSVNGFYVPLGSSTQVYGPTFPVIAVTGASIELNLPVPYKAS